MVNSILMFLLGMMYIAAGVALWLNRRMARPVVMMLSIPLLLAGVLRLIDVVSDIPVEYHMLAQLLFLTSIIVVSTRRNK